MVRLQSLWIYPVKSFAGVQVNEARVGHGGLVDDRRWMLADAETGEFMSQRKLPKMALIHPDLSEQTLTLSMQGREPITVERDASGPLKEVGVWGDRFEAQVVSEEVNRWCSEVMARPCVLVKKLPNTRSIKTKYTQKLSDDVLSEVSFADEFPFLLLGSATLDELNQKLTYPVSVRRFRPNLVVKTDVPGIEDTWHGLQHEHLYFYGVKPCKRCVLVNVDPDKGATVESKEPLKTLATYRYADSGEVLFGQNLLHRGEGVLRVGDMFSVLHNAQ